MTKQDGINLENAKMLQELLEDNQEDLKKRISLVRRVRKEQCSPFSRFSRELKATQNDLELLLFLVKRLRVVEGPECYRFIYWGGEIKSVEAYKRCTEAYKVLLNNLMRKKEDVFSESKTLVKALIQALPYVLIEEK